MDGQHVEQMRQELSRTSASRNALAERFIAEVEFAKGLIELHPDKKPRWSKLLAKAWDTVAQVTSAGRPERLKSAVADAEEILRPMGKLAKAYTVHCVGHAHIDMNWMWSWPETVAVTIDTFSTVLRLMEEYPDFRFSQSQASTYKIIQDHRPDLLAKIAQRVREGRWEVTASHWVEGDKNMASGESLCRHLLYTRRYMQELFGLSPADVAIDWSPDTFGHAATVPTYLVRGGVKYVYLHRPGVHTAQKPGAFWWRGPDGSRVLVRNDMALGYNGAINPDLIGHLFAFVKLTGGKDFMFVYGLGDHGGGPTRRDILMAREMDSWPIFPAVKFSAARMFYERLAAAGENLPVIAGELNTEVTGCYTSQTLIKKANRFAENRLVDAELASTLASLAAGVQYPQAPLLEAWRDTLFSHFHDILPGSGVHDTRTYTHGLYQKTMATTGAIQTNALRRLAAKVDTSGIGITPPSASGSGLARRAENISGGAQRAGSVSDGAGVPALTTSSIGAGVGFNSADGRFTASDQSAGQGPRPFVVFNPTACDRHEVICATVWNHTAAGTTPFKAKSFHVRLNDGSTLPAQPVGDGNYWGHEFVTLAFPADVKALGYSLHTICQGPAPQPQGGAPEAQIAGAASQTGPVHHCSYIAPERSVQGMENELVRFELDTTTGGIKRLVDKTSGLELISPTRQAPPLEYTVEYTHGMTAWTIENAGPAEAPRVTSINRSQKGPYKAAIEVKLNIHESQFTITYELRAGDPRLYIHIKGTWFQRGTRETGVPNLSLPLPLALDEAKATYEIPFGAIQRDLNNHEEVPSLRWAMVTGKTADGNIAGCVLANDSKYGHSLEGSTLRLTLIRASSDPDILPEIGEHEIHLSVLPFTGELPIAKAIQAGVELNHPLLPVATDVHTGELPPTGQFISIKPQAAILSAVKKADGAGQTGDNQSQDSQARGEQAIVIRLYNSTDQEITAEVSLPAEILGQVQQAIEVDLMEQPLQNSSAQITPNGLSVTIPAYGLASVLTTTAPNARQRAPQDEPGA
jgi:alpha-mannosidase